MSRLTINSNLLSSNAQRRLGNATSALSSSFNRLSSGLRINRASDDAAGLSIAESLSVDRRVNAQGIRNINDGISYLNIKEGATEELTSILFRLRELSTQSSNGTLGNTQRKALDQESNQLVDEYRRILETAEFNGIKLFSDEATSIRIQGGYGEKGGIDLSFGSGSGGPVGVGDGTFGAQTTYAAGTRPFSVTIGDFNGDGIPDLATANANSNNISVLLGNGDGTFGAQTT